MAYQEESFLGSGDLQIAIYDPATTVLGGERDVGNASSFIINPPKLEKKELIGYRRANYATTIKSVITKSEQEIKFTLTDINRKNLALAMFGTDAVYAQTAGSTSTDELVTAYHDTWVPLAHRNVDNTLANVPIVTDHATGAVTYVEGTHYEIDYESGRIKALSTGTITNGEALDVDYEWLKSDGYSVTGNAVNKFECFLRLLTLDQANERNGQVVVYKAQIEPSGDIAWLTDDFATLEFTGKILAMAAGTWKYEEYTDTAPAA
jgi:hypothetical protein